ncbi:HET-domain-containing protein [Hypoxylon sp. FL1150]|nr:HET-domain-containing protein [Hypoxylon sp. FL1150]
MLRYKYTPLNNLTNEIRLVTILPGKRGDPIRIQITHSPLVPLTNEAKAKHLPLGEIQETLPEGWCAKETLEGRILFFNTDEGTSSWDHPDPDVSGGPYNVTEQGLEHSGIQYEALSYAWGPPMIRGKAYVIDSDDGTKCHWRPKLLTRYLPLQRELMVALRYLRYEDRSRVMWIDALCINQADYEERSVQVKRMKYIYPLARRVVAWLGPSMLGEKEAMSVLGRIGEQVEVGRDESILPSPGCKERDWYKPDTILPFEIEQWEAVQDLCIESWFERLWVTQEIQLGSPSSVLACGHDELPWSTFRRAFLTLDRKVEELPRKSLKSPLELCAVVERFSLEQLLFTFRDRKCFDKRDKIFGILSLVPPEIEPYIDVNYRQSVLGVYEQVFFMCVEKTQRLTQLRYGGLRHNKATPGWPTWLPEWSQIGAGVTIQPTNCFRASGISASEYRSYRPGQLEVTALRFGVVPWTDGRRLSDYFSHFFRVCWDISRFEGFGYPTGEAFRDVLLQTLTLNMLDHRTPGHGYPTLEELDKVVARSDSDEREIWRRHNSQRLAWITLTSHYRALLTKAFHNCCVFRTDNGYLGVIRGTPQKGDVVSVVLGVDVPLLLRPTRSGHYEVVGDCYVHGIMNAETLLGPLPPPWLCQTGRDAAGDFQPYYYHTADGHKSADDPRLEAIPLPPEWEPMAWRKTRTDPEACRKLRSRETGEVVNADPRMFPEELLRRGVRVERVTLV